MAALVSSAHRVTTRKLYDDKWTTFSIFARSRGFNPAVATPPQVAEFLVYLRSSRRLKGSTISTYLAALASVVPSPTGDKLTKIPELQKILHAFMVEDQSRKFQPPAWDLMRNLSSQTYEPLDQVAFDLLSQKMESIGNKCH